MAADRRVVNPRPVARGNRHAVLAAARDAEAGEILLHNHPSGLLEPSEADLSLAAHVYQEGLGTGIIDNEATELYVIVEPPSPRTRATLDPEEAQAILAPGGPLARRHPGFEDRPGQRTMSRRVAERYNEGGVLIVEAGTGTGKSLAYLVPAALWALRNGERTVVSTNTINLQEQLVGSDLPLVRDLLGEDLRWSLVKGRGNYVSIRRLLLAAETAPALFETDREAELEALVEWSRKTTDGSLSDLTQTPSGDVWEEVRSDGDICLKARCPHFQECFYQRARRTAAAADLLVVNHALLFSDVALREATDNWGQAAVLPPYRHVILDEGHNVEDAATSHLGSEVTRTGLYRMLSRLDRNGKGVLASVEQVLQGRGGRGSGGGRTRGAFAGGGSGSPEGPGLEATAAGFGVTEVEAPAILRRIRERLRPALEQARDALDRFFEALEPIVPMGEEEPLRLGRGDPRDPGEDTGTLNRLDRLTAAFERLGREVEELRIRLEDDETLRDVLEGRVLDLRSLSRRIESARHGLTLVLSPGDAGDRFVRWVEGRTTEGQGLRNVRLAAAPVEPGRQLRKSFFERVDTVVVTSATLSVGRGGFRFLRDRLGLDEAVVDPREGAGGVREAAPELAFTDASDVVGTAGAAGGGDDALPVFQIDGSEEVALPVVEEALASPFDYPSQAVFAVPTDLPPSGGGAPFESATARVVHDLAEMTGGGVFVLFTSHRALRTVARLLRDAGVDRRWPLMVHGEAPRHRLLSRFVQSGRGLLLGTSSFWEGVDVPGDPLRGLVIQKLPFLVPSEPITQARTEALEARGQNPFGSYILPLAALRLKQGFGRLIRSREDRGAILLLDDRILTRGYGKVLRDALPPAPLIHGPWTELRGRLRTFYAGDVGTE